MLSILITAYDKHKITTAHVRECMRASVVPDEIIVINDGGDDSLLEMLKGLKLNTKLIYAKIHENIEWNYNGACNLGVWLSRGDILGIEDTDNIPHKDFYRDALKILKEQPEIGRVTGRMRSDISVDDLHKPQEDWKVIGSRGANQGSYFMRRDHYIRLKGQDERFCGRYGWMYYSWKRQLLGKIKTTFGSASSFYYVVEGQCDLEHKNDKRNYSLLNEITRMKHYHSNHGILNFQFSYEEL